jgi:hypothetical protein
MGARVGCHQPVGAAVGVDRAAAQHGEHAVAVPYGVVVETVAVVLAGVTIGDRVPGPRHAAVNG